MKITNAFVILYLKMFKKKICRLMPIGLLTISMIYVVYRAQRDVQWVLKSLLEVVPTNVITAMVPPSTTAPNTTITTTEIQTSTSVVSTARTEIHFPLDIDLEKYVRDKLEKNITIPVKPINEHNFTYIHRPAKCKFTRTTEDNVTLLILVKSSVRNVFLRNAIRDTWGQDLSGNVNLRFMLGYSISFVETTKAEAETYNDVIVENFVDSYPNNTLKTIMGFTWAVTECSDASTILFIDEDHLPRLNNILAYLRSLNRDQLGSLFIGYRLISGRVYKGKHHWAIPKSVYPYKKWPPYLRGGAYLVSQDIAKQFSIAFPFVKYLHVDDSYLGIIALKLNIKPQHDTRFMMVKKKLQKEKTHFVYNDYKQPGELKRDWKIIKDNA